MNWMKARQTQWAAYAAVYILIVIAALILVNYLAQRYTKSYDSTSNKRFSLSEQTEKLVRNLPKDVDAIYVGQSKNFGQAKDLLDRYQTFSTKLHVKYIDPTTDPMAAQASGARSLGTVSFLAGGRRDEAKSITEEELTNALIRVTKDGERSVCVTSGLGEAPVDDESGPASYSGMKSVAERSNYKVRSLNLVSQTSVPKDCTILVVAGPKRDYSEGLATAIKTYVENGGRAMFFVDPPFDDVSENKELTKVLSGWGVTPEDDIVVGDSRVIQSGGQLYRMGPEMLLIENYEGQAIVRPLNKRYATLMPMARSLDVKASAGKSTVEKLFSSGSDSAAKSIASLKAKKTPDLAINDQDKKGPFVLAAAGRLNNGQPANEGRFVVFGGSAFATNGYLGSGGNRDLVGNSLNWLAADEDLISIRPKDPEDRRIQLTNRQLGVVRYTTLILLPLLIALAGFSVWWQRR